MSYGTLCYGREGPWGKMHYSEHIRFTYMPSLSAGFLGASWGSLQHSWHSWSSCTGKRRPGGVEPQAYGAAVAVILDTNKSGSHTCQIYVLVLWELLGAVCSTACIPGLRVQVSGDPGGGGVKALAGAYGLRSWWYRFELLGRGTKHGFPLGVAAVFLDASGPQTPLLWIQVH